MKVFTVEYHYVTDRDEEMAEVRPTHRAFNGELAAQGYLIAAGPYAGTHDALILCALKMLQARWSYWKPTRLIRQVSLPSASPASGTR